MNFWEQGMTRDWQSMNFTRVAVVFFLISLFAMSGCGSANPLSKDNGPGAMKNGDKNTVIYAALGDSTGAGVGAREGGYVARLFRRIEKERPSSKLTNLCISGATSSDVLHEQVGPAIAAGPTLVTIGIGINDVSRGVTEQAFAKNLEETIMRLKSQTNASIVVTNLPDVSLAPIVPGSLREQLHTKLLSFNEQIKEIANRHGLILVDVYGDTHEMIAGHPEFFSFDGFHPSDAGYEYWAELMWPTVKKAIAQ
jgi:lysophospholipase L1-like esterase